MKLTVKNTKGKNVKIHDNLGRPISSVASFDTETGRITFYVLSRGSEGGIGHRTELDSKGKSRVKKISTIWRGAYATIDGIRVK